MPHCTTLQTAEIKDLESSIESQDSQAIFDRYVAEYRIGVTSSSPPRPSWSGSRHDSRASRRSRDSVPQTRHSDPPGYTESQLTVAVAVDVSVPSTAPPALPRQGSHHEIPLSAPPVAPAAAATVGPDCPPDLPSPKKTPASSSSNQLTSENPSKPPESLAVPNAVDGDAVRSPSDAFPAPCREERRPDHHVTALPRASGRPLSTKPKMDVSQQSPTQDNDGRNYENYYEGPSFVATSPISQDLAAENQTPRDDDSAVVDFGNLSHLIQPDTQADEEEPSSIPDDAAPKHVRGDWRNRTSSSQQQSSVQRPNGQSPMPPPNSLPQTPANRHNPFAGKRLGDTALSGSQLFSHTQFSSAVKHFSPTSSRPSPTVYANNSISPNIVESSPAKNRCNVTSPPDLLSSSPQAARAYHHQVTHERERSPSDSGLPDDGTVPESPQLAPVSEKAGLEPIGIYENMLDSQKRKRTNAKFKGTATEDEGDSDEEALKRERRRRVESKRKAADRKLTSIPIPIGRRYSLEPIEVLSTTKKPRKLPTRAGRYRSRRVADESTASENEDDEFTVADSQEQTAAQPPRAQVSPDPTVARIATKPALISSNEKVPDSAGATQKSVSNGVIPGTASSGNSSRPKDLIPETSPNNTQSQLPPKSRGSSPEPLPVTTVDAEEQSYAPATQPRETGSGVEVLPDSPQPTLPQPSRRSNRKPKPTLKAQVLKSSARAVPSSEPIGPDEIEAPAIGVLDTGDASNGTVVGEQTADTHADSNPPRAEIIVMDEAPPLPSSPPILMLLTKSSGLSDPAVQNTLAEEPPSTPVVPEQTAASDAPGSTTSTLSVLTTTPAQSAKTPLASQESVELPPLSPAEPIRGRQAARSLPRLATGSRVAKSGTRKLTRRATRLDSGSTDELTGSPMVNGFENSIIKPPKMTARGSRLSMLSHTSKENNGKPGIFSGMAFAISFQSKKDGEKTDHYEHRLGQSRDIEKMIVQSGGYLLSNGFDELFESNALGSTATSPVSEGKEDNPLTLTSFAQTMGFTALVADGHSRKVKYMQALALGLPCISDRWVTTCVAKAAVIDWLPYLLCAGQSTFLRDAMRSRYLAPYSAINARLVDVVEKRPKMLEGSKILLVMKKSRAEEKKMPYVFLAHVLGATLSRAYSVDEAKETLRHRELLNDPFDWVYVDEHTGSEEGLFNHDPPSTKTSKGSKKRKRAAATAVDEADRPPKRIRTLSNELVIQSLILGRMIEEGELEA
ncbi:DNA repair protein crb2 [Colletotrichum shisoi]|uniref:DNA repair protein crb2 n=1 Tax=Colletotrichum shisoi TaxID=2078593 RepID=A0A5Q4BSP6_9PEZI|nr:DNA repair protein crb2 [Colletotrichum shisoi]